MPPSIWPSTASGLIALPTSCAVPIQTTRVRPELDVDLDDDAHRGDRERDVRPLAGDLARLGIERRRARVAVDALDVDLAAAAALALLERRPAGVAHGAGRHPRHPRGGRRAGRADRGRRVRRQRDVVGAELRARDLEDHADDALTDLGGGASARSALPSARSTTRAAQKSSKPSE